MAAHRISSFTITQPFLGAPLQFQPALGSRELEELIDAYVVGPASKQDKLSEVTIDFYNRATVDISNGSLVRRYDVVVPSQSPAQSQSSGFSPIYTPSPSSSATFGDSRAESFSMTPPTRSRVSKKPAKKETKKAAEFRLPGFSIMTKDGVDVTSSAGRGTKTKEQREHAHMMRIMKACEDCKKKKVRCDPSHRRSNNGSSAASVSTPTTKNSSPARQNYSPASVGPPISKDFAPAPSTDDFILFPEDSYTWNAADASPSEFDSQAHDLSNFDFDVGDIDMSEFTTLDDDNAFDWSFAQPSYPIKRDPIYKPLIGDPYNVGLWTGADSMLTPSLSNSGSASLEDFEQPGTNPSSSSSQNLASLERSRDAAGYTPPSPDHFAEFPELTFSRGTSSLEASLGSVSSASTASSLYWNPSGSNSSQSSEASASSLGGAPLSEVDPRKASTKKRLYSLDGLARESLSNDASPLQSSGECSSIRNSQSDPLPSGTSESMSGNLRQGRAKMRLDIQTVGEGAGTGAFPAASLGQFAWDSRYEPSPTAVYSPVESTESFIPRNDRILLQELHGMSSLEPPSQAHSQQRLANSRCSLLPARERAQLLAIEHGCSTIASAIHELRSARLDEHLSLLGDLRLVRQGLNGLQTSSSGGNTSVRSSLPAATVTVGSVAAQLQVLAERVTRMLNSELLTPLQYNRLNPEGRRGQRQQQVNARRLVRSLCATISSLQVLDTESSPATRNSRVLTSRHNKEITVSPEYRALYEEHVTAAIPRLDCTVFPVHNLPVVMNHAPAPSPLLRESGLDDSEKSASDRSKLTEGTGQLETVCRALRLPLFIIACIVSTRMVNLSTVVLLGVQIFMSTVAACILRPGNGLLVSPTATRLDRSPTSSLLRVAASWLPLSAGSSGGPGLSLSHTSSKPWDVDGSVFFGALRKISASSHML